MLLRRVGREGIVKFKGRKEWLTSLTFRKGEKSKKRICHKDSDNRIIAVTVLVVLKLIR
jgi:hypothetical protein